MNRIALLVLAGLSLTACASQPKQISSAETTASLQCQYDIAGDEGNYDPLYAKSGRPAVDAEGNPHGLSLVGYVAYRDCMATKGHVVKDGVLVKAAS